LLLDDLSEQIQGNRAYRIIEKDPHLVLRQRDEVGEWKDQYRFTLQTYTYADYAEMCRYHQTSPQSHFTKSRICSRATEDGRITLSGMRFIATSMDGSHQVRHERTLTTEDEYADALRDKFGIVMTT
jgi:N-hydroxyarylamine O-acetyltransferase